MDPGIFVRGGGGGGPGQSDKKSSDVLFFFFYFFFSPFFKVPGGGGGSNIYQGGGGTTFSRSDQLLIPYRNPYNVIFQGVRTPCSPLWIRTCGSAVAQW